MVAALTHRYHKHGTTRDDWGEGATIQGSNERLQECDGEGEKELSTQYGVLLLAVIRVLKEIVDESGKTQKIFLLLILGLCMYAASPNKRNDACLLVELHTMYLSSLNYGSTAILVWRVVIFQPL